jgi:hypothetical protein
LRRTRGSSSNERGEHLEALEEIAAEAGGGEKLEKIKEKLYFFLQ